MCLALFFVAAYARPALFKLTRSKWGAYMAIHVDFEPIGRRGKGPAGQTLLDYARQLGVDLVNLCGGAGSCGRCVVQIVEGPIPAPTPADEARFTPEQLAAGYRLACRMVPVGDCTVRVPPASLSAPQRTQVEGEEIPVAPEPLVETCSIILSPPSLACMADAERLIDALVQQAGCTAVQVDLGLLRRLSPQLRHAGWQGRAVVRDGQVVALLPSAAKPLGLAVDLGTTKIAAYLVALETGQTLAARGMMNPQIAYGEDVVARMILACRDPAQSARLQELVAETLNTAVTEMVAEVGATVEEVVEAVVVANTAMHHLFLHLPVEQLAKAPYVPAVQSALDVRARDVDLNLAPGAYVHLLPNVAGYVGADHVAMALASGLASAQGVVLALDIGTNTEVCLVNRGALTSVSCASGPAFEGAHIKHGMRAATGAIERVRLVDHQIEYQTIGDAPPVGLCGSGILDSLAELYRAGIVDAGGRLGDHPRVLTNDGDGVREFVLVSEKERGGQPAITVTQKDIRELQLAKGAMRAGVQILLESQGISEREIDQVIIAGAFGSYIDVSSAIAIGMLPALPVDRFRQVGNAAGMGAKMALVSRAKRSEAQMIARRIGYIELARHPRFTRTFAQAMYLGE